MLLIPSVRSMQSSMHSTMGSTGGAKGPGVKRAVDRLEQGLMQQAEVVARHEKEILQVCVMRRGENANCGRGT